MYIKLLCWLRYQLGTFVGEKRVGGSSVYVFCFGDDKVYLLQTPSEDSSNHL